MDAGGRRSQPGGAVTLLEVGAGTRSSPMLTASLLLAALPPRRHEKDTAVILGKEQERLEEEAAAAGAAAQRMERVMAAVGRAAAEPLRCALPLQAPGC